MKRFVTLFFMLILVASCAPGDSQDSVSIKNLTTSDYEQIRKSNPSTVQESNITGSSSTTEFYSLLTNDVRTFNLTVELNNAKKQEITAIEFACEDPKAEIELENSKGESEWFPIAEYSIANWGGTNRYHRTFSIRISDEYLSNKCTLTVTDIEVSGKWGGKKLDNNEIHILLEEKDVPFSIKTTASDEENVSFIIDKKEYVTDIEVIGATKNEEVYTILYGTELNILAKALYGDIVYEYVYTKIINKTKLEFTNKYNYEELTTDVSFLDYVGFYIAVFNVKGELGFGLTLDTLDIEVSSDGFDYEIIDTICYNLYDDPLYFHFEIHFRSTTEKPIEYVYAGQEFIFKINGCEINIKVLHGEGYNKDKENYYLYYNFMPSDFNFMPLAKFEERESGIYEILNFPLYPHNDYIIAKANEKPLELNYELPVEGLEERDSFWHDIGGPVFEIPIKTICNPNQKEVLVCNFILNLNNNTLSINETKLSSKTYEYFYNTTLTYKCFLKATLSDELIKMNFNRTTNEFELFNYSPLIINGIETDDIYDIALLFDIYGHWGLQLPFNDKQTFAYDQSFSSDSLINLFINPISLEMRVEKVS